jgi:site-specific DNA-methyltransferase (adenine-specific)
VSEGRPWKVNIVGHGEEDPRTLVPYPLNPKIHTAEQDAVVEASLNELGWLRGVLKNLTTGHLLDGHERVELSVLRGEATVPVDYVRIPAAEEPKALMLLDPSGQLARTHVQRWAQLRAQAQTNESAILGLWAAFAAQHKDEIAEVVPTQGVSSTTGAAAAPVVEERGAALQTQWETAHGQLWGLGPHKVYCGDCTTPEAWGLLRERIGLVQGCITSPPYAEQRLAQYGGTPAAAYGAWFLGVAQHLQATLTDDGSFFLNLKEHSEGIRRPVYVHQLVVDLVERGGWEYLDEFVWDRPGVPGDPVDRGKFKNMWEPVFWFAKQVRPVFHPERVKHRAAHAIIDTNYHPGLWTARAQGTGRDFLGPDERRGPGWAYPGNRLPSFGTAPALGHAGAFPVGLPQWFVDVYSDVGDWWVEPFLGSGSTLMACEATGRQCWGMDQDPRAVAITLARYQDATGTSPRRVE